MTNTIGKRFDFPSNKKDWNKFEKNYKTIALNISYIPYNTERRHAYKSKHDLMRENQVILLMITDGEKWHYLVAKRLSALGEQHEGDFYCLNCFQSTEEKLEKHKNICENYDYCYVGMSKKDNKLLKDNHGAKPTKIPFIIYAHLESLLEKISAFHNNPKTSTTKINKHTSSGYSFFTRCSFDATKNKFDYYRGKNCMKNFCLDL